MTLQKNFIRETRISEATGALKYDGRTNPACLAGLLV